PRSPAARDRRTVPGPHTASRQAERAGIRGPRGRAHGPGARARVGRAGSADRRERQTRVRGPDRRIAAAGQPAIALVRYRPWARHALWSGTALHSGTALQRGGFVAPVPTDIEIAQAAELRPIADVAAEVGLTPDEILPYGRHKAKITAEAIRARKPTGRLVLVTGINPTPAGEGKSTVTVGLAQAFRRLGQKVMVCIREPSLGPVFGVKGGAAGGGYAQVVPMDEINLHFTGDFHAITSA